MLGSPLWEAQRKILASVRDHPRTAVRSCHGAGKSYVAARAVLWHLYTHEAAVVATTAPTFRQVRSILWQEIRRAHGQARIPLGGELLTTELKLRDGWFAVGLATDTPDGFQGLHSRSGHMLVVIDEAAGVPRDIWSAVEGVLSSRHARLLTIGNPTDPTGPFADEFKSAATHKIHISAFDTPNFQGLPIPGLVTPEWVQDKAKRWGETNPLYTARVRGDFPQAATDTLIPLAWIEAAQQRDLEPAEPHVLACDVARYGSDETVIAERWGSVVRIRLATSQESTMQTVGRVIQALRESNASSVAVDVIGVGGGVVDRLLEQRLPCEPINVGEKAYDSEHFVNRRAELYWGLRQRLEQGDLDLDPTDDELAAQLSAIKYAINSRGQVVIEAKEEARKRGIRSPDRADAVMMACAIDASQAYDFRAAAGRG